MAEYLSKTGLQYYHNRIKNEFASASDLSDLSDRVDDIVAEGGEPNVIDAVKVNGTALVPDANKAVDITVPTAGSAQNPSGYATYSDLSTTSGEIDDIQALIPNTATTSNKLATAADIPTAVSDLTNDSGFQDATQVQTAIDNAIAGITGIEYQVTGVLPDEGEKGVIYLVPNSGTDPNVYDEYIWIDGDPTGSFEKIGTTAVDLSGYWAKTELVAITTAEIDDIITPPSP